MMMMKQQSAVAAPRRSLASGNAFVRPCVVMRGLVDKDTAKRTGIPGSPDPASAEVEQKVNAIANDGSKMTPTTANMRADLGMNYSNIAELQAFDGPAPETINSRLAMLGVLSAVAYEATTGLNIQQQVADHPWTVALVFATFIIASYIPILKGYTRKEAFANGVWTPKAENWNGRVAQIGFVGMLMAEVITHTNALSAVGLEKLFQ